MKKIFVAAITLTLTLGATFAGAQVLDVSPGETATVWMVLSHDGTPHSRFVFVVEARTILPRNTFYQEACDLASQFSVFLSQLGYNPAADDHVTGMYFYPRNRTKIANVATAWPSQARVERIELQRRGVFGNWVHEMLLLGVERDGAPTASEAILPCAGESHNRGRRTSPMWQYYK